MRLIDADAVADLVDFPMLCLEMINAFETGAAQSVQCPEKCLIQSKNSAARFLTMPVLDPGLGIFAVKIGTIFPRSPGDSLPTVHADMMIWCAQTGQPIALIDGNAMTQIKCAAVSAIITDRCTRQDVHTLAIVGSGAQAAAQIQGVGHVRQIKSLRLTGRTEKNVRRFAQKVCRDYPDWKVSIHPTVNDAIAGADIVATTTSATRPQADFSALGEGIHVNCMGGHDVEGRELPHNFLLESRLIVEDRPTAIAEAGSLHENAIDLTELFTEDASALRSTRTVFSSTGHAFLDLLTAVHLYRGSVMIGLEKSVGPQPTVSASVKLSG
ncbi:MAG: hypothetical protein ABJ327_05920 [Litoreibacter sp.]